MLLNLGCIRAGLSCGWQPHWGITTTTADGRRFGCCLTLRLQVAQYWAAAGDHPLQQAVCSISLLCIGLSIIAISAGFLSCCNFCSRCLIKLQAVNPPYRSACVVQAWTGLTACSFCWPAGHSAVVHLAARLANTAQGAGSAASCPSISDHDRPLACSMHPDGGRRPLVVCHMGKASRRSCKHCSLRMHLSAACASVAQALTTAAPHSLGPPAAWQCPYKSPCAAHQWPATMGCQLGSTPI